jgi:uncharacterized protein YbjT (DUF2867 family)
MQATMKIGVVGATGRVGHHAVEVLRERGYDVVPMARSLGINVATGEGLAEALQGVECVIDAASWHSPDQAEATKFFLDATRNLQTLGHSAGVRRLVVVSIIGIDRFTSGYYAAKQAQERAMLEGPIPVRLLRAAQFHEFVAPLVDWGRRGDRSYVQKMRTQLVSARTVAEALVDLATDTALGETPRNAQILEIAGPREERLVDAAILLVSHRGDPVQVEEASDTALSNAGDPDKALYESSALLPSSHAVLAGPTFKEWVEAGERQPGSGMHAQGAVI